jgi:hypothetical protein
MKLLLLTVILLVPAVAVAGGSGSGPAAPRPAMIPPSVTRLQEQLQQTESSAFDATRQGHYLRALTLLEQQSGTLKGFPELQDGLNQSLATAQSFVGLTLAARQSFGSGQGTGESVTPGEKRLIADATLADAVQAVVAASRGQQVVMLNEAHHIPQSREFARRLLLALRQEGFTYVAAETFSPGIAATQKAGYPDHDSGYYSAEPVFGELIRSAVKAGYTLVPYEAEIYTPGGSRSEQINDRERQQAENLRDRIFKVDPKARVFVYVGYSHNLETPQPGEGAQEKWMALRLRELTGIDPLTVDQVGGLRLAGPGSDSLLRQAVIQLKNLQAASVLKGAQGQLLQLPGQTRDIQVFQPDETLVGGRPKWLYGAGRRAVAVQVPATPGTGRKLVQAFYRQESKAAIPADQVVMTQPGQVTLLLLPGTYRLVVQDEAGHSSTPLPEITVP